MGAEDLIDLMLSATEEVELETVLTEARERLRAPDITEDEALQIRTAGELTTMHLQALRIDAA